MKTLSLIGAAVCVLWLMILFPWLILVVALLWFIIVAGDL